LLFRISVGLLFVSIAGAQTPVLTPAVPAVKENASITITSSVPVTWSLAAGSAGSIGVHTTTSMTYTAPASVVPKSQMYGCPTGPNDSVFNTRVDSLPVNSNSATWIANSGTAGISVVPSWGQSYADGSTPTMTWKFFYGMPAFTGPLPPQSGSIDLRREGGNFIGVLNPNQATDHHIMTIRRTDCTFWETYNNYLQGGTQACQDLSPNCNAQSGITYPSTNYAMPTLGATDAAGLPLAPLVWHLDEIKAGLIQHAVRFTTANGFISGTTPLWPASEPCGNCLATLPPPTGARLRLKSSFSIPGKCTGGTTAVNTYCTTMLTALAQYGMIVADVGLDNQIVIAAEVVSDPDIITAITEMSGISISNFEGVDESSLQVGTNPSYEVNIANGHITPSNYAVLTATPTGAGSPKTVPIAIQGAAIGLKTNTIYILANTPGYQINSWVNGVTNQTVTWTKVSGVGSVSSGGIYTAPTTGTVLQSAVLKATSFADSNATALVYVTVLPLGTSPSGSVRINVGAQALVTDGSGNVWQPDLGMINGFVNFPDPSGDFPHWTTSSPERLIYESTAYTIGNDFTYSFVVPNGNYQVRFLDGFSGSDGYFTNCCVLGVGPNYFEANGQIGAHVYDWGLPISYLYRTPTDIIIPAKVTTGDLYVTIRPIQNEFPPRYSNNVKNAYMGGIELIPDAAGAHWTIDTEQQTTITPGQTLLPFFAIDWYSGQNCTNTTCTWSIGNGFNGASITSGGVLTLASGTYFNGQPIVAHVTNGTFSADATVYTAGGAGYVVVP
jgi:hypothetical protein